MQADTNTMFGLEKIKGKETVEADHDEIFEGARFE